MEDPFDGIASPVIRENHRKCYRSPTGSLRQSKARLPLQPPRDYRLSLPVQDSEMQC